VHDEPDPTASRAAAETSIDSGLARFDHWAWIMIVIAFALHPPIISSNSRLAVARLMKTGEDLMSARHTYRVTSAPGDNHVPV